MFAIASPAAAQGTPPAAANAPPPTAAEPWYGWQVLLLDAAALATAAAVSSTHDSQAEPLGLFAGTWYGVSLVGAPAVHYAHGRGAAGLLDFSMRAFAPPLDGVFGLVGSCLSKEFEGSCVETGWGVGSLIGSAGAAAFDALVLSRPEPRSSAPPSWYGLQILAIDLIGYGAGIYYASRKPHDADGDALHPALAVWVPSYIIGFIGAPIVHFAHGEIERGFGSLGLRLLVGPLGAVFGLMGYCAATGGATDCSGDGALWGLLGGALSVSLLDAFALAREPVAASEHASSLGVSVGPGAISVAGRW
ncbi:MAG TPA: hypothetical protein VJR89_43425 [Polyangiales bacterium]|nr:hypothetical protein [Polyangiales bacterium]